MKVLVTGGAGLIGLHIVKHLLHKGYEVVCIENFNPYYDPEIKKEGYRNLF